MTGATYVLLINLFVTGLLACAFLMIAAYDQWRSAARWLSASYGAGMAYLSLELIIATNNLPIAMPMLSYTVIVAAFALFNVGLSRKFEVRTPWALMLPLIIAAPLICYLLQYMPRQSVMRMTLYQSPFFILQIIGAGIVLSLRKRHALDNTLVGLLLVSAVQFIAKPLFLNALGGTGDEPRNYLTTGYALLSQSMGTISAIAVALLLLIILLRDALTEAWSRSETDMLSGLLNRRGFENRATAIIRNANRKGEQVSLVLCDIDYFKSINDNFGHAAGDRVITFFSQSLTSMMPVRHLAGRVGGEEFALLLPGMTIVEAKLLAERARNALPAIDLDNVTGTRRLTASFGIAELVEDESFDDLMARSDKALYVAKNSGRNCVKIAQRPRRTSQEEGTAIRLA